MCKTNPICRSQMRKTNPIPGQSGPRERSIVRNEANLPGGPRVKQNQSCKTKPIPWQCRAGRGQRGAGRGGKCAKRTQFARRGRAASFARQADCAKRTQFPGRAGWDGARGAWHEGQSCETKPIRNKSGEDAQPTKSRLCETKPIPAGAAWDGAGGRWANAQNEPNFPAGPGGPPSSLPSRFCRTNPIPGHAGVARPGGGLMGPSCETKPIRNKSGEDAQPRKRRLCETKPNLGAPGVFRGRHMGGCMTVLAIRAGQMPSRRPVARASRPCVSRASCPRFEGGTPSTRKNKGRMPSPRGRARTAMHPRSPPLLTGRAADPMIAAVECWLGPL